jgi:hypothetical protein
MTARRSGALALWLAFSAGAVGAASPDATVQVLPTHPSTLESIAFRVTGSAALCWPAVLVVDEPQISGEVVTLAAHTPPGALPPGCSPGWPLAFEVAGLPAGSYSAEFRLDGDLHGASAFDVRDPAQVLELRGSLFLVTLRLRDPLTGKERSATAVSLTDESGFFWFFEPGNVEVTVKILDGRALNGHYWLFVASMTDVGFTIDVQRNFLVCADAPCGVVSYSLPAGRNANVIDTDLDLPQ